MIKIIIIDDQQLIVEAWTGLLNEEEDFQVVNHANNEQDGLDKCLVYRPDIILLDINLKNSSGIDLCEKITNQLPKSKVIGLSLHDKVAIAQKMILKGAKGYLTKNVPSGELIKAIREVSEGNTYICKEMQDKFVQQMVFNSGEESNEKELTFKEIEILKLIAQGMTSKEISDELSISARTVETHRHNILKKLHLPNTARLISWSVQNGYLN